jgi:hypothetical protein
VTKRSWVRTLICYIEGMANVGPEGHFCPTRALELANGYFLTGSDKKCVRKLALSFKNWPAKVPSN